MNDCLFWHVVLEENWNRQNLVLLELQQSQIFIWWVRLSCFIITTVKCSWYEFIVSCFLSLFSHSHIYYKLNILVIYISHCIERNNCQSSIQIMPIRKTTMFPKQQIFSIFRIQMIKNIKFSTAVYYIVLTVLYPFFQCRYLIYITIKRID